MDKDIARTLLLQIGRVSGSLEILSNSMIHDQCLLDDAFNNNAVSLAEPLIGDLESAGQLLGLLAEQLDGIYHTLSAFAWPPSVTKPKKTRKKAAAPRNTEKLVSMPSATG